MFRRSKHKTAHEREIEHRAALNGISQSGITLPGYVDFEVIARGGSSIVMRARELRLNRPVAVKVIPNDPNDRQSKDRFEREKEYVSRLGRHPFIVQVFDAGHTTDGFGYLVMEYFERGSVADWLQRDGTIPAADACDLIGKIALALSAAHQADILHRDVKPSNILLSEYGPALADFGISRSSSRDEWTQSLDLVTPWHAAPEILRGESPSVQSDLYSLASTLVTCMTGRPPFAVTGPDNGLGYQLRVQRDALPPMSRTDVPPGLDAFLNRAMAKEPADRFPTAEQFGRELAALTAAWARGPVAVSTVLNEGLNEVSNEGSKDVVNEAANEVSKDVVNEAESCEQDSEAPREMTEPGHDALQSVWGRSDPVGQTSQASHVSSLIEGGGETRGADVVGDDLREGAVAVGAFRRRTPIGNVSSTTTSPVPGSPALGNSVPPSLALGADESIHDLTVLMARNSSSSLSVGAESPPRKHRTLVLVGMVSFLLSASVAGVLAVRQRGVTVPVVTINPAMAIPRDVKVTTKSVEPANAGSSVEQDPLIDEPASRSAVEVTWLSGEVEASAVWVLVYRTGDKTYRQVPVVRPLEQRVFIPNVDAAERYCFAVAVENPSGENPKFLLTEQTCINNGQPYRFAEIPVEQSK